MADIETDNSPAGEALREEVGRIMADPAYGRNPALTTKIDRLYRDRYGPGKIDLSDGIEVGDGFTARGPDKDQPSGSTEDAGAASPEDAQADARALAQLRSEKGDQFDSVIADAHHGQTALSTTLGVDADDLIGAFLEAGGDRVVGIKTLATYGRQRRT